MPGRRGPNGPHLPRSGARSTDAPAAQVASVSPAPENLPELVVEWMPDASPSTTDGTWVSMTPYVTKWSTKRGRQYELDQFAAGQISVTLETFDRLFDPENTAGTYYGKLKPMRQIRVRLKWQGVFYPVARGYVTSWGQTVEQDKKFVTTVTARDGFERLEQIRLPSSAWALEIVRDNPSAWFRMGESGTTRMTDNSSNGNYGVYDNCQQGETGLVVNDSDAAVGFAHSLEERAVIQNPNLITGYPFTISCMLQIDSSDPAGQKMIFTAVGAPPSLVVSRLSLELVASGGSQATGSPLLSIFDSSGTSGGKKSEQRLDDNLPHHLAVVVPNGNKANWRIYIDGVDASVDTGATSSLSFITAPPGGWVIGNFTDLLQGDYGFGTNDTKAATAANPFPVKQRGIIDEFCVWNGTAVASDRIAAHSLAAKTGWSGDDSGTRVSRFLDRINWPSDLRNISTGASILGAASWSTGSSALSVLHAWADTEAGAFFIARDGKLVWRSRHYPLLNVNATRSRATFGDAHSAAQIKVTDMQLDRDATLIRNPVIASRKNGVTVQVRDDALADNTYGDRTWSAPVTEDRDDATVRDRGMWFLARYKNESLRLSSMVVHPREQPTTWATVLDLELGDRVTVNRTPLGQGSQLTPDQILEQINWTGQGFDVHVEFSGSPVDPNVGSYLILDDSVYGLLDTGLLAY